MKKNKSGLGRGLGAFGLGKNILAPEGSASPTPAGAKTSGAKKPAASAAKGKGSSVKNAGAASLHPAGSAGTPALISIERIQPNRFQPRREFDESALEELRESIAQHGILQPLIVRDIGGGTYELIAGERRLRAAKLAGLTEIPAVFRIAADAELAEMALIENLQREDLNPIE